MFSPDLPISDVLAASRRSEVIAAMEAFYAEADRLIAARGPTCWNRGLCCRFGEYGHRLYVTAMEVAYYVARPPRPVPPPSEPGAQASGRPSEPRASVSGPSHPEPTCAADVTSALQGRALALPVRTEPLTQASREAFAADVCPHAVNGICCARDRRPLGCRIFYCDPAAQDWQGPLTEKLLSRLRDLHERYEVPYFYADWMAILRALSEAQGKRPGTST